MSQNLGTKLEPIRRRCRELGAVLHWRRRQVDTDFVVAQGRLKLREEKGIDVERAAPDPRLLRRSGGAGTRRFA